MRDAVEFLQDGQAAQQRLQAALPQQQANCIKMNSSLCSTYHIPVLKISILYKYPIKMFSTVE